MIRTILALYGSCCTGLLMAADGAGISIGESELVPNVSVIYFTDDNVYAHHENEIDDNGLLISPSAEWSADKGLKSFALSYYGEYARYEEEDLVDYDDHSIAVSGDVEFSSRSRLSGVIRLTSDHEEPGFGRSKDLDARVDGLTEIKDSGAVFEYSYGARSAKGGLEFSLEYVNRDYQNNSQVTDGFSFNRITPSFTFLYAISSATRITSGIEYSVFDYERSPAVVESDNKSYFIFTGAKWDITGKSGGSVRVGYGGQNFDNKSDQSAALLRLGTYWSPLEQSRISLDITRNFSIDTATPSITTVAKLGWRHGWSGRFSTNLEVSRYDSDSDFNPDDLTTDEISLIAELSVRRWLDLTVTGKNTTAASPTLENEYDRQWLGVGFTMSL